MKTSGVFTLHRYRINVTDFTKPIRLIFWGDVHRDSPLHAHDKWREFREYARKLKNAYFLGMGDYCDGMSTSERDAILRANLHESTLENMDGVANGTVGLIAKEIECMRGRIIGLLNGNHFYSYPSGINSDQKLCEKLGCKYLGVSSFVRLEFHYHSVIQNLDVWAHHGGGASRLPGGSINRVDQMREHAEADIYVSGHDHRRGAWPANPRLHLMRDTKNPESRLMLKSRQQWLVKSGSFLMAYEDGRASYNVDVGRGPCSLGHAEIEVTLRRTRESGEKSERTMELRGIA
jgi:hypothetical protein